MVEDRASPGATFLPSSSPQLFCFSLQVQEPQTDRQLIETSPVLQKLTQFEDSIGVLFTHVRLLARAFTLRTVGFNHLTL